jgi:hypothetical protein
MAVPRLAYLAALVTLALTLTLTGNAAASCQVHTISYPDGRMRYCQVCCYPSGNCYTNCW